MRRLPLFPVLSTTIVFLVLQLVAEINGEPRTTQTESSTKCLRVPRGEVHRFDNRTQQCYKVGSKGPCGELMIFYADPTDSHAGECDCDIRQRCNRPLIYWPPKDRCYLAFEQGPCEPSDWLVFTTRSKPTCRANPCMTNRTKEFNDEQIGPIGENYWVEAKGECVQTNTQGFCHYPNEVVAINGFTRKVKPHCTVVQTTCTTPNVPSLFCAPGQKWAVVSGMCDLRCKKTKTKTRPFNRRYNWRRSYKHGRRGKHNHHNFHNYHSHAHDHRTLTFPLTTETPRRGQHHHHHHHSHRHDHGVGVGMETSTLPPTTVIARRVHADYEDIDAIENEIESDEEISQGYNPREAASENADNDDDMDEDFGDFEDEEVTTTTEYPKRRSSWRTSRRA